ncbi:RraA family protein [Shumkonia mesophila]|uniref:RraA family protein n=1 Tax=Shumkonia mesophila TaxID=2838854 RepID=UPI0029352704|nr:RraA family protein [Shumkonia mesophila]
MHDKDDLPDTTDLVARFMPIPTGLVTDALSRLGLRGWMDDVLPLVPGTHVVGRARTIAFGPIRGAGKPQQSMYALISRMAARDVMVVGSGGTRDNLLGDNVGAFAERCGLNGIVTDSKVRDCSGLRELNLAVFCRGPGVRPPSEVEPRAYDVDVDCGGAQVRPGDIIVGDDDGITVVPADRAEEILTQIEDLMTFEAGMEKAIRGGGTVEDIQSLLIKKKTVKRSSAV